jgi:hypothetical protein
VEAGIRAQRDMWLVEGVTWLVTRRLGGNKEGLFLCLNRQPLSCTEKRDEEGAIWAAQAAVFALHLQDCERHTKQCLYASVLRGV